MMRYKRQMLGGPGALVISSLSLILGAAIARFSSGRAHRLAIIVAAIGVAGLVAHHAFLAYERIAFAAPLLVLLGMAFSVGLGKISTARSNDEGAHHSTSRWALVLAALGVALHSVFDGVILGLGDTSEVNTHGHDHETSSALAVAVLVHRVPAGATIVEMFGDSQRLAVLLLALIVLLTPIGFFLAGSLASFVESDAALALESFLGGVLLHVLVHIGGHASHVPHHD